MSKAAAAKATGVDLLEGALFPKIIRFCIPVLLMHLLQTLYSAADMYVVGFSEVEGAIGSIGTTAPFTGFFANSLIGFSLGANVLVARYIGARDQEKTSKALHTAVAVSAAFGLINMTAGELLARRILTLMGVEGHILDLAEKYVRIYFLALPFLSLTNCFMAVFRAKGDTRTPLYVMTASGLLNVILNFIFVLVFRCDVDGVAWATVISNVFSAAVLLTLLMKDKGWCHFSFSELTISKRSFRDILIIGLPSSVQSCLFALSNMVIMSSITKVNSLVCPGGSAVIDGNAAANNMDSIMNAVNNAVCQAASTFASQHLGARKFDRLRKVRWDCLYASLLLCLSLALPIFLFRRPLVRLFVSDEAAIQAGITKVNILVTTWIISEFMDVHSAFLRGLGKSLLAAAYTLCGVIGVRVLWILFLFPHHQTLAFIYLSYPISWAFTAVFHYINVERQLKKLPEAQN